MVCVVEVEVTVDMVIVAVVLLRVVLVVLVVVTDVVNHLFANPTNTRPSLKSSGSC